jgi:glutathione S-transferase
MYSEKQPLFNCYQRAHQNTLENIPTFLSLLLLGGLFCAKWAAGAGVAWVVGRVVYALGYYTGAPKNRLYGFAMTKLLGELPLMGMVIGLAGGCIGWW